jgi:hypothetical protein
MHRALRFFSTLALPALLSAALALPAAAQALPGSDMSAENLRPYHFLFLAYALAWILVFGWVVSGEAAEGLT